MKNAFLLQFNPRDHFRIYDAILNMPDGTNDIVLDPGKNYEGYLIYATKVYLWESGDNDLVGEGTITQNVRRTPMPIWQHEYSIGQSTPDPLQKRVIIRVERCFRPPIKRAQIQENALLAKAIFFKNKTNTEGPCFKVPPAAARELDALIADVERARFRENVELVKESIEETPELSVLASNLPARVDDAADGFQLGFGEDPRDAVGHPIDSGQGSSSIESAQPLTETNLEFEFDPNANEDTREKQTREIAVRPGQTLFKWNLLDAYSKRCAVSGCDVEAVLEAAHIRPYRNEECHHISNGLLLRSDIHVLFDKGLITIDENREIRVATDLMKSEYAPFDHLQLRLPVKPDCHPSKAALAIHRATPIQNR